MSENDSVTLTRDVEASMIPVGTKVTLQKGGQAYITQSLGGSYTVVVNGNMFRIEGKDADALGMEVAGKTATVQIEPFASLTKSVRDAIGGEAESLTRMLGHDLKLSLKIS